MDKHTDIISHADTLGKSIGRRAAMTGAVSLATVCAMGGTLEPASATGRDPIIDLVEQANRIRHRANQASDRSEAIRQSAGGALDSGIPQIDLNRPEFAMVADWIRQKYPDARIPRVWIEQINHDIEGVAEGDYLVQAKVEGAARLAHWDDLAARYDRTSRDTGYTASCAEAEALFEEYAKVYAVICEAEAITVEGAMAQLTIAARGIEENYTYDGVLELNSIDDVGVLNAAEALSRLLPHGGSI